MKADVFARALLPEDAPPATTTKVFAASEVPETEKTIMLTELNLFFSSL